MEDSKEKSISEDQLENDWKEFSIDFHLFITFLQERSGAELQKFGFGLVFIR